MALCLPGAITVYTSFHAGGFFVGTPALLSAILAVMLVIRVAFAERPFAGMGDTALIGASSLALLAAWTLLSVLWSHAPARTIIAFDRVLLYLLAFLLIASVAPTVQHLRVMVRFLVLGMSAVCMAGLISRALPALWPTSIDPYSVGISYPVTYSNTMGLLASVAIVLCMGLSADLREPPVFRVLAAAVVPMLGATLLLTFSRGAIAAGCIGVIVVALVARPRALGTAVVAIAPATTIAITIAYGAVDLTTDRFLRSSGVAQGHRVAIVVAICTLGAAAARLLLLRFDERRALPRLRASRRRMLAGSGVAALAAATAIAVLHGPGWLQRQFDRFTHGNVIALTSPGRARLTNPGNDGRLAFWHVALRQFAAAPLHGRGADTYELYWTQQRRSNIAVVNAHSLYLQTMSDLGIVGLLLVVLVVATVLVGMALRLRGVDRALHGTLLAAALMWALHAAVDWDWQMPAITLWLFMIGGAVLASRQTARATETTSTPKPARGTGPVPSMRRHVSLPSAQRDHGARWYASLRRVRSTDLPLRLFVVLASGLLAVLSAGLAISQASLVAGAKAFDRGDCQRAVQDGLKSISALDLRPEPYELISYCDSRAGRLRVSVQMMGRAVTLDPHNWEYWYGLALVRGAAGLDPRPAAREAVALNPRSELSVDAEHRFRTSQRSLWQQRARAAPLPF